MGRARIRDIRTDDRTDGRTTRRLNAPPNLKNDYQNKQRNSCLTWDSNSGHVHSNALNTGPPTQFTECLVVKLFICSKVTHATYK